MSKHCWWGGRIYYVLYDIIMVIYYYYYYCYCYYYCIYLYVIKMIGAEDGSSSNIRHGALRRPLSQLFTGLRRLGAFFRMTMVILEICLIIRSVMIMMIGMVVLTIIVIT